MKAMKAMTAMTAMTAMDGELCLDENFPEKKSGMTWLTHWTTKHIGKFTLKTTRNWGAVKPTDSLGRCEMFHGIYQHYEIGFTKKKLRFNINQSSKIAHTHPTQMCFPSLAFSFKKPLVPPPCFRTPEPWQWASSPKQWAHSRASQAGFCLQKNVYVCIGIYIYICTYTHLFVFLYIYSMLYIVAYWYELFIIIICVYLSSNPWWNPWFCSSQFVLRTGTFPDPSCAITATTPRGIRRTTTCSEGGHYYQLGLMVKKIWKDQKIQKYEITKSLQLLKISSRSIGSILQRWLLKSPRQDTAATSNQCDITNMGPQ